MLQNCGCMYARVSSAYSGVVESGEHLKFVASSEGSVHFSLQGFWPSANPANGVVHALFAANCSFVLRQTPQPFETEVLW